MVSDWTGCIAGCGTCTDAPMLFGGSMDESVKARAWGSMGVGIHRKVGRCRRLLGIGCVCLHGENEYDKYSKNRRRKKSEHGGD